MTERIYKISADVDVSVRATSKSEAIKKAEEANRYQKRDDKLMCIVLKEMLKKIK